MGAYKDTDFSVETTYIRIGADVTGIGSVGADASGGLAVSASRGQLTLSAAKPVAARVVATDGKTVWSGSVSGTVTVSLPSGIYIVNGQKVAL